MEKKGQCWDLILGCFYQIVKCQPFSQLGQAVIHCIIMVLVKVNNYSKHKKPLPVTYFVVWKLCPWLYPVSYTCTCTCKFEYVIKVRSKTTNCWHFLKKIVCQNVTALNNFDQFTSSYEIKTFNIKICQPATLTLVKDLRAT